MQESDKIKQAELKFIEEGSDKVGEQVFPNYFPVTMLKAMLKENGFVLTQEQKEQRAREQEL